MDVHPTCVIDDGAKIHDDVTVGPFTIIGPDVEIGPGVTIGSHCVLGEQTPAAEGPLVIEGDAVIRSHSVFYAGSTFKPGLRTGHYVTSREGMRVGRDFQLGHLGELQGDAVIGDYTRFQSRVAVGKNSQIGNFVWLYPWVGLTNDPTPPSDGPYLGPVVEDYAVVAVNSILLPGVRIGEGALVGAHSLVTRDVGPDRFVTGSPAEDKGPASRFKRNGEPAYPWRRHFHRGYPKDVVDRWIAETQ